ncbi:hypothetical protein S40288_07061 [Stachybotrys chartarum IBT 40288]|nr:hypothetical protein S40288_07061 [Stachybotrys chartarum IBT 40288]
MSNQRQPVGIPYTNILREKYNFQTQQWQIPTVRHPSRQLRAQMVSFLKQAGHNHLLIIYYAGHGYVGSDGHLYWACTPRKGAAKLKWDGVRRLFEDARSDILLLLDTCSVPDPPITGSHGIKQAIAACSPDYDLRQRPARSFTANLTDVLKKLAHPKAFSAHWLYEYLAAYSKQQQQQQQPSPRASNGTGVAVKPQSPLFITLTPGQAQILILGPLPLRPQQSSSQNGGEPERHIVRDENVVDPVSVADPRFDDARISVGTSFDGDATPDMSSCNQRLQNTPPLGATIAVEGMFLGHSAEVEGSAEMQEAAEQLKALSHARHRSDETPTVAGRQRTTLPGHMPDASPHEGDGSVVSLECKPSPNAGLTAERFALPRQVIEKLPSIPAANTKPFSCNSTFGSQAGWKKHIVTKHLCLTCYRCSMCPDRDAQGRDNKFHRKDPFTQHLYHKHAPPQIKRSIIKGDGKLQTEWDYQVKQLQKSCLVPQRQLPQELACPKVGCFDIFKGSKTWDRWAAHVGRHTQIDKAQRLGLDGLFTQWALGEGIIEPCDNGYQLCAVGELARDSSVVKHTPTLLQPTTYAASNGQYTIHVFELPN